jgi:hypothetical protein
MGAAKTVDKTPYEKVVGVGVEIVESKRYVAISEE